MAAERAAERERVAAERAAERDRVAAERAALKARAAWLAVSAMPAAELCAQWRAIAFLLLLRSAQRSASA